MADNITPVVNETKPVSDEVSVITEGTIIKGDVVSKRIFRHQRKRSGRH